MKLSQCFSVFTILGALTLSVPAWADIPPEDVCLASNVGKDCSNAPGAAAGVCQEAMCTRATPDGPMSYSCYRCLPANDGGGGQANEAGGAEPGGGANSTSGGAAGGTPSSDRGGASAGGSVNAGTSSTSGAAANTAGSKSRSTADAANSKSGSDDGGCSLSQAPSEGGALWAGLTALGLTFVGIRRRRSLTS